MVECKKDSKTQSELCKKTAAEAAVFLLKRFYFSPLTIRAAISSVRAT